MALKNLVADRAKVTEEMIESIISDYVRYDPQQYEIVLTPAGMTLSNDAKVLVILVAHLGWQYVVDAPQQVDARPATLEKFTGIPGGTLRPILKKLKDAHLISVIDGNYSAKVANLDAISSIIKDNKGTTPKRRFSTNKGRSGPSNSVDSQGNRKAPEKAKRRSGVGIRASLDRLVKDGFFNEARTLGEVLTRLHELAIIAKITSLSGPIAELVREGKLTRKKVAKNNKEIWAYKAV